jgi:hypothetical protein
MSYIEPHVKCDRFECPRTIKTSKDNHYPDINLLEHKAWIQIRVHTDIPYTCDATQYYDFCCKQHASEWLQGEK